MKAENRGNEGFLQRESVEHQGYAEARSTDRREGKERGGASDLLEAILDRDNLNRAYKRVKSNHGAAGIDGMSVEEALPWLKEHKEELLQSIRDGSYEPSPVRRKEIPKPDGGVRKLGIPTVVDRVIQQGIAQKLQNIWEPLFSDSSYGYRPKRSGQQAIQKVKEYAEAGYRYAVSVDFMCEVSLPNREISLVYNKEILQRLENMIPQPTAIAVQEAIFSSDNARLKAQIQTLLTQSVSCFDTAGENFYHGFMLGLCALLGGAFVTSNRESGDGRYDIQLKPMKKGLPGILIELKAEKNCSDEKLKVLSETA